ncbi:MULTISPECIES: CotH kinase family protein [Flavobacteriaceae]|uniref:Spore coat protein CotH n=2 Tax=Flavobacteriaceae TaxID=49546 RepID=A0A4Y8ATX0_9FLAO|nr:MULTISPECIES: CotH kinase family protein [Flavobacteriaceae]TEW75307.1 spore coat protein CotH [Gramella jeungdoensis]GGK44182.1 hypothetical protein GCM10007963_10400 [Lutibacter litoralis]
MHKLFKQSNLIYFYLIISFISVVGCTKNETSSLPEIEDTNLVFESLVFEKKNNPNLSEDIVFDITDGIINGKLKKYFFNAIPTFSTNATIVEINGLEQISEKNSVDFRKLITYNLKSASGTVKAYTVNISWDDALAHIYFNTEGGAPIISKDDYLYGVLTIDGQSRYEDLVIDSRIKGRGNSTWVLPKKPYKLKLSEDASILGLAPEKDWVLLADYLDGTHLLNAVAFKVGQMLEMPFTNTIIPVEVTINNEYQGLYNLTEQVEVKSNRVNVGKDGLLLELDANYDEEWQFKSATYNLPVLIKDPELDNTSELAAIKSDFETLEELIAADNFPNNNYRDYIDDISIAKYLIVYMLTLNEEINHPKSTYIHKTATGKYTMGPLWDFDWGYGYEGTGWHFNNYNKDLFWSNPSKGTKFFTRLMSDPIIEALIKEYWEDFKANHYSDLMDYINEYDFITQGAKARNSSLWPHNNEKDVDKLKQWIENRISYMNTFINNL